MSEIKIYDCHNTNTINNTRKYVAYEDFIAYKEKAEAEIEQLKSTVTELQLGKYGVRSYCDMMEAQRDRAVKAEAEVVLLRKNWISLARQILAEHDRDGWCRLVVPKESAQNMLNVLEEKDGEG